MFERLAKNASRFEEKTKEHINEYADAGLRTLVLAYRELDEEEYKEFDRKFYEAKNSVSAERESLIDKVTDRIERDLILLGSTAVEDKLQNGVSGMLRFIQEGQNMCPSSISLLLSSLLITLDLKLNFSAFPLLTRSLNA